MKRGIVSEMLLQKESMDQIKNDKPSSAMVLKYLIDADSLDECYEKMMEADRKTEILDAGDRSMRNGLSTLTYDLLIEKVGVLI